MRLTNSFLTAVGNKPWTQATRQWAYIQRRMLRVLLGTTMLGGIFYHHSYGTQDEKSHRIPLTFSEISKTTRNLAREGKTVPPLTRLYSVTNDVSMKVFEAHNLSHSMWDGSTYHFAYELEKKIEPTMRIHKLIGDYAKDLPADSRAATQALGKQAKAAKDLPSITMELSDTWDDNHHDVTRTEYYTEDVCDSKNNCHSELRSREVYDHTNHSYEYYAQHGEAAARLLVDFIRNHPDMNLAEQLVRVTSTEAENESAIRHSFAEYLGKYPSTAEYVRAANIWATGSNLSVYMPVVKSNFAELQRLTPLWNAAKKTAHDERYSTNSHSDAGPQEFQISESAQQHSAAMDAAIHKITDGIEFAGRKIPLLDKMAKECVNAALHHGPGDPEKLCPAVLTLAKEIYKKNFEGGVDIEPFKWEQVLLWTLLGMALGAAAGAGVNKVIDYRQSRGPGHGFGRSF